MINISEMCNEGLDVTFTMTDCRVVNEQKNIKRNGGVCSGNDCYMWKSSYQSINTSKEDDVQLWHQELG